MGPHEWGESGYRGRYIGSCILHDDRTWTLALAPTMEHDPEFMDYITREQGKFQAVLENAESMEDVLPVFEESFGHYGRVLAFMLGKSLAISMDMAGIKTLTYHEAKGLLSYES